MEWSTRPPQGNPEVRKRREPGPGGTRDGDGGLEEIPSSLEAPPEGEERERGQSAEKQALPASPALWSPVSPGLPLAGASCKPVVKAAPREAYSLWRLSLSPKHSRGEAGNRSEKTLVIGTLLHPQHLWSSWHLTGPQYLLRHLTGPSSEWMNEGIREST